MLVNSDREFLFEKFTRIKLIDEEFLEPKVLDWSFVINKKIHLEENAWQCNNCDFKHKLKYCA